ncbi:replication initiation protein, partial [Streptomyces sp. NPDC046876]|uniref:replication initiation protein n=1 Tax=Streptomyces sp. NPDC046876 TaxID=3155616 RepID=UPI0034043709
YGIAAKVNLYLKDTNLKRSVILNENHVVTQSNRLIEARHMKPLSAREQKIILTMVSMIQPSDIDFKEYSISIKEFSEMLGLKGHAKYEEIKEVALNLQAKTIFIPDEDGFITTNWVASQRYQEGEGIIKLSFSPYLKPYLLQLKTQFTSYLSEETEKESQRY